MILLARDHGDGWSTTVTVSMAEEGCLELAQRTFLDGKESVRPMVNEVSEGEARRILHNGIDRLFDERRLAPPVHTAPSAAPRLSTMH